MLRNANVTKPQPQIDFWNNLMKHVHKIWNLLSRVKHL
jgi:hypothetical protein